MDQRAHPEANTNGYVRRNSSRTSYRVYQQNTQAVVTPNGRKTKYSGREGGATQLKRTRLQPQINSNTHSNVAGGNNGQLANFGNNPENYVSVGAFFANMISKNECPDKYPIVSDFVKEMKEKERNFLRKPVPFIDQMGLDVITAAAVHGNDPQAVGNSSHPIVTNTTSMDHSGTSPFADTISPPVLNNTASPIVANNTSPVMDISVSPSAETATSLLINNVTSPIREASAVRTLAATNIASPAVANITSLLTDNATSPSFARTIPSFIENNASPTVADFLSPAMDNRAVSTFAAANTTSLAVTNDDATPLLVSHITSPVMERSVSAVSTASLVAAGDVSPSAVSRSTPVMTSPTMENVTSTVTDNATSPVSPQSSLPVMDASVTSTPDVTSTTSPSTTTSSAVENVNVCENLRPISPVAPVFQHRLWEIENNITPRALKYPFPRDYGQDFGTSSTVHAAPPPRPSHLLPMDGAQFPAMNAGAAPPTYWSPFNIPARPAPEPEDSVDIIRLLFNTIYNRQLVAMYPNWESIIHLLPPGPTRQQVLESSIRVLNLNPRRSAFTLVQPKDKNQSSQ